MKKNDLFDLTCTSLGANLEGVCHADGIAVFVPGMLPDETAPVRIVKVQSDYAFGILDGPIVSPSPTRVMPDCPAYPKCGGCDGRHMSYEATLEAKRQKVQGCFQRIAHMDLSVPPVLGMDDPFHYRNKTSFPVGGAKDDPILGFFAPRSHRIISTSSCPNAMEPTDGICSVFLDWMKEHRLTPYQEQTHTGLIRHLVIRVNSDHESMVTLVARKANVPFLRDLARRLEPLHVTSLILNVNSASTNVILGPEYLTVAGSGILHDRILGLDFALSPASFFQVNVSQAERLYTLAISYAGLSGTQEVFDVYCGTGTISLLLARHAGHVTGIEVVPQAIENAILNAQTNRISNVSFHTGTAEELLPLLIRQHTRPDVIVVDPPRKGLEPSVVQTIWEAAPDRLVYVSCNPATLARDVALFAQHGYHVINLQCVDMFCYASDVETVCLLSKIRSAPHIDIDLNMTELEVTKAETKATYEKI